MAKLEVEIPDVLVEYLHEKGAREGKTLMGAVVEVLTDSYLLDTHDWTEGASGPRIKWVIDGSMRNVAGLSETARGIYRERLAYTKEVLSDVHAIVSRK